MAQPHSITVRRSFPTPRRKLFEAFETAQSLSQWFTPADDISLEIPRFDFRQGGGFHFRYRMPSGEIKDVTGIYEAICPPDILRFTWEWAEPDPHAGIPSQVKIEFIDQNQGCEIVLTHSQLPPDDADHRHAAGWTGVLTRLADATQQKNQKKSG